MPAAVRARFDDYAKKDDFRGDMKSWKKDLMHVDQNGKLVQNDLPNAVTAFVDTNGQPDDSLWDSLYLSVQNALIDMSANRDSFKDNKDATKFLDDYFGDPRTKIFSLPALNRQTITDIEKFVNDVLKDSSMNSFAMFGGLFNDDYAEYNDFITSLDKGKYKSDPNVRNKLVRVISAVASRKEYGEISNQTLLQKLSTIDLNGIITGLNSEAAVNKDQRNKFKNKYQEILNTLHDKDKVFNVFKEYDKGKISKQLNEAIAKTDYTGKITEKDRIAPKRDDKKTLWQNIEDGVKDTYADTLKKYMTAHRDHIYVKPSAKVIVAALDSEKIKPVDGIAAILDKQSAIAKRIEDKSPTASAHFDWFAKTMQELKNTMPKAFAGALRNGRQLHHLVEEMALKAIEDNKIEEAKTAMEILSVMRYGLFTSRTNKTDVNIFSDSDLSWNKNQYIQLVTKATDKTIKFGLQAVGYTATGVINGLRRTGTKFNHSGKLQKKSDAWEQQNQHEKDDFYNNEVVPQNNLDQQEIQQQTNIKNTAAQNLGLNNTITLDQRKADLQTARQNENVISGQITPLEVQEKAFNAYNRLKTQRQNLQNEINTLTTQLTTMPVPAANQYEEQRAEILRQELATKNQNLDNINQQMQDINDQYQTTGGIEATFQAAQQNLMQLRNQLGTERQQNAALDKNINNYDNANSVIETCQDAINARNQKYQEWDDNHKNRYMELMGFWDFLNTGHTKNLFRISTKKVQKKMDNGKMAQIYTDWMSDHSYAA